MNRPDETSRISWRGVAAFISALILATLPARSAEKSRTNSIPPWSSAPLSVADAVNLALKQNGAILRGKADLEAQYGVVIQTRAVAIPKVEATGNYQTSSEVEAYPFPLSPPVQRETWYSNIRLIQSIYEGGRITASFRSARLTKDQAVLQYQTVVADAVLTVRVGYYDVLSAAEQVVVNEASVKLLTQTLDDQNRRFEAGTVPRFNVLQAEVELANERPKLIQARNALRISKNNL
ncbi:MAG TPA: TolC family protein, partial [Verrucomicrobiae bacterium]|nr:TolC family protein [Verrucomicrobiae bacterium]